MFSISFVISIITVVCLWIRWRINKLNLFKKCGIPGPEPNFFTGNFKQFQLERTKCCEKWFHKYGKIFGFYLGAKPYIMCSDIEFLKIMQIKEFKNFCLKDRILPDIGIPHESIKNIMPLQKGIKWKNLRSVMTSCFTSQKIKMTSTAIHDPIVTFMEKIKEENGKPFDITQSYKNLMFNIIWKLIFSVKFNEENEEYNKIIQSLNYLVQNDISSRLNKMSMYFPEFEPLPTYFRLFMDTVRYIMNFSSARFIFNTYKKIITVRKQLMNNQQDILQTFLEAEITSTDHNKKLTIGSIHSNITLFMIAGYDAMSFALGWCTHYLAQSPKAQEKIRQEINTNIEKNKDIQYEDLAKLQHLDQALSETLRLSPLSLLNVNRVCEQDFEYKGMIIPKNVGIFVPVPILHRDPNYWQEPDKFDPDRFSPENRRDIDPMIYQPFGAGPRKCVANRIARAFLKLIMANLIRSFIFDTCDCEKSVVKHAIFTSREKESILIKATPISSNCV